MYMPPYMQTECVFGHVLVSLAHCSQKIYSSFFSLRHFLAYLGKYVFDIDRQVAMGTAKSSYNTEAKPSRATFKSDSLEWRRTETHTKDK